VPDLLEVQFFDVIKRHRLRLALGRSGDRGHADVGRGRMSRKSNQGTGSCWGDSIVNTSASGALNLAGNC
jgi:hypothetical protein